MNPAPSDSPKPSSPATPEAQPVTEVPPAASPALTPEEQMALYEKELKETDWGHQPC